MSKTESAVFSMTYTIDYGGKMHYYWDCSTGSSDIYFLTDTRDSKLKAMRTKIYRAVVVPRMPLGNFRSFPAQIGSASPYYPVKQSRPLEHPQRMSNAAETEVPALEPRNGSTLALECPPE